MTQDAGRSENIKGEVKEISWGSKGTSALLIEAKDVTQAGTWYAAYSWDGDDKKLTLTKPTQQPPPKPAPAASGAPSTIADIEKITIETWGSSKLDTPLEWSGQSNGFATIVFKSFADISGPIGKVVG